MKAWQCTHFGPVDELEFSDLPDLTPGPGEVLIDTWCAVANPNELRKLNGRHHQRLMPPFIPSGEVSGYVRDTGPGVTRVRRGDRVMARLPQTAGGFAEQALAPERLVVQCPQGMPMEMAASFMGAQATAYDAVVLTGRTTASDTVLVLGATGGVGLAAVEIAKALGATVIAVVRGEDKRALAENAGADHVIDALTETVSKEVLRITQGAGANVIIDPVGGDAFRDAFRCIAWRGRLVVVGMVSDDIPEVRTIFLILKGVSICGANWLHTSEQDPVAFQATCDQLFRWFDEGKIRPHIGAVFPFNEVPKALKLLESRGHVGKVIVQVRPPAQTGA